MRTKCSAQMDNARPSARIVRRAAWMAAHFVIAAKKIAAVKKISHSLLASRNPVLTLDLCQKSKPARR